MNLTPEKTIKSTKDYALYALHDDNGSRYVVENLKYHIFEWEGEVLVEGYTYLAYLQNLLTQVQAGGGDLSTITNTLSLVPTDDGSRKH